MAPMMAPMLRLYEDVLASDAEVSVPAHPRMIYVVHGAIIMGDLSLRDDEAFGSEKAVTCKAERAGATLWRWELAPDGEASAASGPGVVSREKLSARLDTMPKGAVLLRGDSVAFPPAAAPICTAIRGPASAACSTAASASTPRAIRRRMDRAAPGLKADPIRCSRRRPIRRRVSFVS